MIFSTENDVKEPKQNENQDVKTTADKIDIILQPTIVEAHDTTTVLGEALITKINK